ncbi:hypothetical protein D3C76_520460 [compost metagenome]
MSKEGHQESRLWSDYIQGNLSSEKEQQLEKLLLDDEEAFQMYLQELELLTGELPALGNPDLFTHNIISALPSYEQKGLDQKKAVKSKIGNHRNLLIYHYLIAASITLLLLGSGFFDLLSVEAGQSIDKAKTASISDRWMDATSHWIDTLKENSPKKQ